MRTLKEGIARQVNEDFKPISDTKLEKLVFIEKVRLLHANLLIAIPANFFCATVVFYSLYLEKKSFTLYFWYLAVFLISGLRFITYFLYQKDIFTKAVQLKIFTLGTLGSALLWGLCALFLMPANHLSEQMLIIVIIAGITAGALQTLMPNWYINIFYISIIILPLLAWLFLQHHFYYTLLGITISAYLIFMISAAKSGYNSLDESLHLRYENNELIKILREQSIRDPLTKLFNRRFLLEVIPRELKRLIHEKRIMCVGMIDVDYFKLINDSYGHEVGDEVLKFVGKLLLDNFRGADIACRFGGEEFVLVLVDTNLTTAYKRLEAICQKIKESNLIFQKQQMPTITVSVGLAEAPLHGSNIDELIHASDKALYYAKKIGRNRIEFYDSAKDR